MRLRARLYELLEDDERVTAPARLARAILLGLILMSVAAGVLDTVRGLDPAFGTMLRLVEAACMTAFTLEYAARVWSAVEDRAGRYMPPLRGRLRYMLTPMALVDLAAVLPFWLGFLAPYDLVFLRLLRLLRIVKITRYSPALSTLQMVFYNERRALLSTVLVTAVVIVVTAGSMHIIEGDVQPERFGSIPAAMWWATITITTVGYGDATPATALGRVVAALTALLGIGTLALPTAILGAGFARELHKQDFLTRASMVARVPLFRRLAPAQLAEVSTLLHPRTVPPRLTIIRRGEHPEAMYFIDQGRVVVRLGSRRVTLGPGTFFGEMALLEGTLREATVVTLTPCRLLVLDAGDFHRVIGGDPVLREAMLQEARRHAAPGGRGVAEGGDAKPRPSPTTTG